MKTAFHKAITFSLAVSLLTSVSPAHADNSDAGTIIGGIIGGVIGNTIGKGPNGKIGGTIIGGIIGATIGHEIGASLDDRDHEAIRRCQRRAWNSSRSSRVYWRGDEYGSRSGANGSMYWEREGYSRYDRAYCRYYTSEVTVRGRTEVTHFSACRYTDGSWREVEDTDVVYNSGPVNSGFDDEQNGPDFDRPTPRMPDRPPVRPQRPQAPRPPMPPQQQLPYWIATNSQVNQFVMRMQQAFDDEARIQVGRNFYMSWPSTKKFLTLDQVGRVIATMRWDNNKVRMVKLLRGVTDTRYGSLNSVLSKIATPDAAQAARRIITSPVQNRR